MKIKDITRAFVKPDVSGIVAIFKRLTYLTKARTLFKNIFEGRSVTFFSPDKTLRKAAILTIEQIPREDLSVRLFASKDVENLFEKNYIKLKRADKEIRKYESSTFRVVYPVAHWLSSLSDFKKMIATCILFFLGQVIGILILILSIKMIPHLLKMAQSIL